MVDKVKEKVTENSGLSNAMRFFKERMQLVVYGSVVQPANVKHLPSGTTVTSVRARTEIPAGSERVELTGWSDGKGMQPADVMGSVLLKEGQRFIAIGEPTCDVYKEKIQYKLNVRELWAEVDGKMKQVVSRTGIEQEVAPLPPLEVPDEVPF